MNKEQLLEHNIRNGAGLLLNCYYDDVIREPKPIEEWVDYIYKEIITNFDFGNGVTEMNNGVLRFFGKEELKKRIITFLMNDNEVKPYIKHSNESEV